MWRRRTAQIRLTPEQNRGRGLKWAEKTSSSKRMERLIAEHSPLSSSTKKKKKKNPFPLCNEVSPHQPYHNPQGTPQVDSLPGWLQIIIVWFQNQVYLKACRLNLTTTRMNPQSFGGKNKDITCSIHGCLCQLNEEGCNWRSGVLQVNPQRSSRELSLCPTMKMLPSSPSCVCPLIHAVWSRNWL